MTKPRSCPTGYVALIVEPIGEFSPINWRQTPAEYRVYQCLGPMPTRGQADAWKFLYNRSEIKSGAEKTGQPTRWAVHVSLKQYEFFAGRAQRTTQTSLTSGRC